MKTQKSKTKRILLGISVFIIFQAIAWLMFSFVWLTAPPESMAWLENNYNGLLKYLIIGAFTFSVSVQSVITSFKIVNYEYKEEKK